MLKSIKARYASFRSYDFCAEGVIRDFVHSISRVFVCKLLTYFITTITTIIAVRNLLLSEFGKIGIINGVVYLLFVPMTMGVNSGMYKYLPTCRSKEKDALISVVTLGSFISIPLFSLLYLGMYNLFIKKINISFYDWKLAIIFTGLVSISTITESYLRGQKRFDSICRYRFISAVIVLYILWIVFLF